MSGTPPIHPSRGSEVRQTKTDQPEAKKQKQKDFALPKEREKGDEKPEDVKEAFEKEKKSLVDDEKARRDAALNQSPFDFKASMDTSKMDSSKMAPVGSLEGAKAVDEIAKIIKQMVETMRVGTVEGKQVTSIDLKPSNDFLSNANMSITQLGEGKIAVSLTNINDVGKAIQAVEQNKAQLEKLVTDLQVKGIVLSELRVGDQTITLPTAKEGVTPPTASIGGHEAGYRERGEERGGGGQDKEEQEGGKKGK